MREEILQNYPLLSHRTQSHMDLHSFWRQFAVLTTLLGLVALAGGCASATALPVASFIGSPNATA